MIHKANVVTTPALPVMDAALAYAAIGWPVIPTWPNKATPKGGWSVATIDPARIRKWWTGEYLGANISVAPGQAAGFFVLDVDVKSGQDGRSALAEIEDTHGYLPDTVTARTRHGGLHEYYRAPTGLLHPDRVRSHRVGFAPGLDFRAHGDLATVWPTPGYVWIRSPFDCEMAEAPGWLLGLLTKPPEVERPPPAPPVRMGNLDRAARYLAKIIDGECGELASMAPHTGRNQRLFIAAARLGSLVGGGALHQSYAEHALIRAAFDCGLVREDGQHAVRATIASGIRRGLAAPRTVEFRR